AGVGHGADDRNSIVRALLDIGSGYGCGNGNDQRVFTEGRLDFLEDIADDLWLYRKENNIGIFDGAAIVGRGVYAKFLSECRGLLLMTDCGCHSIGSEKSLFQIRAKKDTAKFAGTQDSEIFFRKFGGHGQMIVTEEAQGVNNRMGEARERRLSVIAGTGGKGQWSKRRLVGIMG